MMPKPIIRKASVEDAGLIADLHIRGWQGAYHHLIPAEKLARLALREWVDEWQKRLENPQTFVYLIEISDVSIGFVAFGSDRDEVDVRLRQGEIYAIYLHPDWKAKGYGTLLCQAACDRLQQDGFNLVVLWVLEANYSARRFYEILGFQRAVSVKQVVLLDVPLQEIQYQKEL
ncbi:GNAT family N-acetyltransferase [Aquicella lusitana]|uniref:Ribosomal protein S18 acetylase RimI-like enzyme n=1 Tax=Aquicella lusitana TaxID=254246 RepID=A0A370GG42_9COXI|nr:GNAT family N-acetyltransferase [Aquicella lusitana]RDI42079.1 ribosomal protein S18 acetylase RimI-like enzyme [Aquicella lusitana]VVC74414.1 Mycothiol acetyltransferase [Aquicella lusitana]